MFQKKRILIICDLYLPSTKGGGGMWSVVNLVERFADRYDFWIITRNHPSRNDFRPFKPVKTNEWNTVGSARVFYMRPADLTAKKIGKLYDEVSPDGVFLNSVFSTPTIKFLLARRRKDPAGLPVMLAPCGEFSESALRIKAAKKSIFLFLSKMVGLHRNIVWKATSESEASRMYRVLGKDLMVVTAPDLPPKQILPNFSACDKPRKAPGSARFVHYSRVDPMKNLKYLLQLLRNIRDGDIELAIAGPVEDKDYWNDCLAAIETLPGNIKISLKGTLTYEEGLELLKGSHFFILPTLGENLGYAILEAMAAGCPVMLSDRTIWDQVDTKGAGWAIQLSDQGRWMAAIEECIQMDNVTFQQMSARVRQFAVDWINDPLTEQANTQALATVFG